MDMIRIPAGVQKAAVLLVLLGTLSVPVSARAADPVPATPAPATPAPTSTTPPAPTSKPAAVSVTDSNGNTQTTSDTSGHCSIFDLGNCFLKAVVSFIFGLANFLLGIAGSLLNWVIVKTVFQFSELIGNTSGVLAAWGVLRDIGNIMILFGFIFMGLATILELQNYNMKKALPGLILFAVFLNFSLFAAEAIIDTSNVLSKVLYSQANTNPCVDLLSQDCAINQGIAGHIMQSTGLSGIYDLTDNDKLSVLDKLWVVVVIALFATIGTFVLLAAAIMLMIRAVMLTLLIVSSPIGFAGSAIPPLSGFARQWREKLLHQAFFAPILLLLIFVSLKISDSFGGADGNSTLGKALMNSTPSSVMGIIMVFCLSAGFLIASIIAANRFGATGAAFASNTAAKFAFGIPNAVGQGVGRYSRIGLQNSGLGNTAVGRYTIKKVLRPMEGGILDSRKIPGVGTVLKQAGATTAAKPTDSLTNVRKMVDNLNPRKVTDADKAEQKKQNEEMAAIAFKKSKAQLAEELKRGALSPESERFIASLSTKQMEEMGEIRSAKPEYINALAPEQFDNIMKSDNITPPEKASIANVRFEQLENQIAAGDAAAIRQWSNKDLQQLAKTNGTLFNSLVTSGHLSDDQQEALGKSDALTRSQKDLVRTQTPAGKIETEVNDGNHAAAQALAARMSPKNKVKLSGALLSSGSATDGVMSTLTPDDLGKIMEDGKLTIPQKANIVAAINDPAHPRAAAIQNYLATNVIAGGYWI